MRMIVSAGLLFLSCIATAQERLLLQFDDSSNGQQFSTVLVVGDKGLVSFDDGARNVAIEANSGVLRIYDVSAKGAKEARKGKEIAESELSFNQSIAFTLDGANAQIVGLPLSVTVKSWSENQQKQGAQKLKSDRERVLASNGKVMIADTVDLNRSANSSKALCAENPEIDAGSDCLGGQTGASPTGKPGGAKCCVTCGETTACGEAVFHTCGSCSD